ncbi:MAG: hypothetical protein ACNA7V_01980 [Bacteroidales bacterium]
MEDIFLIIIGLLWLAYTFYSRSQKKQRRQERSSGNESPPQREPTILEQILMGQEVSIPEPEEYDFEVDDLEEATITGSKQRKQEKTPEPFLPYELAETKTNRHSAFTGRDVKTQTIEIEHLDFFSTPGFYDEEFNLRNAVIYQAVLETPYIDFK